MLFRQVQQRLLKVQVIPVRTATKRASGGNKATNNTAGRRLGPKKGEGQFVQAGQIIWRQRGTKWYPGENAGVGRDHTIYAREPGFVRYYRDPFHAKRRFIGVALAPQETLPTPHFAPRRRRFGYKPIDNEDVADFEKSYLTKKETERLLEREAQLEDRLNKRATLQEEYQKALAELVPELSEEELDLQAVRFIEIRKYMNGGMAFEVSRDIVDSHNRADLAVEVKTGRLSAEEADKEQKEIDVLNKKVDDKAMVAMVDAKFVVVKFATPERRAEMRSELIKQIEELTKGHEVTPGEVIEKVELLLKESVFSTGDRVTLRRKHLRRPLPIPISPENRKEFEKLAKKGEGEIRKVWLSQQQAMHEFYIPTGASMIFN